MKLEDSAVVVTGASRGLGRALAEQLAERGARVVLTARDGAELERIAAALTMRGLRAHALPAYIADKRAIYPLAGEAAALVGPIDVLINNASTLGPVPLVPLLDTACEDLELALAVNLVGPFRLIKAVLGSMVVRGRGVIVNVSSDAAVEGYPTWGAYGASKAALDHLTRVWANEHDVARGVRMLTVDPGEMDTQLHAAAMPDEDRSVLARPERVASSIVQMIEQPARAAHGARLRAADWSGS
jgi:NAD(P)-dependent dehydrogenase (short-subunit alcohol dehydrogenase family)